MNRKKRAEIFRIFKAHNPSPTTELDYRSNFELLISVMLSAQATDVSVNKATLKLYRVADTPQKILSLGKAGLIEYIKSIGLYRTKAENILKTCAILMKHYNGEVPDSRKALESLPGVGRKTANVVLNTAFSHPTMAVDTHIFRISNRINLASGKDVKAVEAKLLKVIPKSYLKDAHHWLILHGRYICTARKPKCGECPIFALCEFPEKAAFL